MKTTYQRLAAVQDLLLTAIMQTMPTRQGGGELARYDYTYNAQRQIATWRQMQPSMAATGNVTSGNWQLNSGSDAAPNATISYTYDSEVLDSN